MQRRSQTVQNTANTTATPSSTNGSSVPMTPSAGATPTAVAIDAAQATIPATPTNAQANTSNIPTMPEGLVRQFPQVGQGMLAWFATPPVDVVTPPQPFHSVAYLAYKQRQRSMKKKNSIAPNTKYTNQRSNFITKKSTSLSSMTTHEKTQAIVYALKELTKQQEQDTEKMQKALSSLE